MKLANRIESTRLGAPRFRLWKRGASGGFSLVELVATIAVAGLLSSIVVSISGQAPLAVAETKLRSDVTMLNQLVALYLADGGALDGITSPQFVLDALKQGRPVDSLQQHTGIASGRLLDTRLRVRLSAGGPGRLQAFWDTSEKRFYTAETPGPGGIEAFYLDNSLADVDYGTKDRRSLALKFNRSKGWVWGSVATSASVNTLSPTHVDAAGSQSYFNPAESASGGSSGGGSGSGGTGGGGGGSGSGGSSSTMDPLPGPKLPAPIIMPDGGTFSGAAFPSSATINSNGSPAGQSHLMYQVNHGPWQEYSSAITLTSGDIVTAQNVSLDPVVYSSSNVVTAEFYQLVTSISGEGSPSWSGVTGGPDLVQSMTQDGDTITFTHGNPQLDLGGGQHLDAGVANVISFTPSSILNVTPNADFLLGDVTVFNGTTFYDSEANGVTLKLALQLSEPATTQLVDIQLGFVNNENSSDREASADAVELLNPSTAAVFSSGGVTYHLELSWLPLDPGSGGVNGTQFRVYEGATAHARLMARFVPDH